MNAVPSPSPNPGSEELQPCSAAPRTRSPVVSPPLSTIFLGWRFPKRATRPYNCTPSKSKWQRHCFTRSQRWSFQRVSPSNPAINISGSNTVWWAPDKKAGMEVTPRTGPVTTHTGRWSFINSSIIDGHLQPFILPNNMGHLYNGVQSNKNISVSLSSY